MVIQLVLAWLVLTLLGIAALVAAGGLMLFIAVLPLMVLNVRQMRRQGLR